MAFEIDQLHFRESKNEIVPIENCAVSNLMFSTFHLRTCHNTQQIQENNVTTENPLNLQYIAYII